MEYSVLMYAHEPAVSEILTSSVDEVMIEMKSGEKGSVPPQRSLLVDMAQSHDLSLQYRLIFEVTRVRCDEWGVVSLAVRTEQEEVIGL